MGFFSNLTGGDSRKDIRKATKAANAELDKGYAEALPFYDEAMGIYEPYAETGRNANKAYNALLGLGTDEDRTAAQARYFDDPAQQRVMEQQSNALLRQMNARGGTYGGRALLAGGRLATEGYNGYLDRVRDAASTGGAFSGQQAALKTGIGDLRYGLGTTKAGLETSKGSALAGTRSTGINNLIGGIGALSSGAADLGKAYLAFSDIRLKRDVKPDGTMASGLPVYTFRYHGDDQTYRGVMAHEAYDYFPDAVVADESGYLMVDYARIS